MSRIIITSLLTILFLIICSCAGDDSGQDRTNEQASEQETTEQQTTDSESTQETQPADRSSGENLELPAGWPESLPIMEGFDIISSESKNEGNELVIFVNGNVDIDDATDFYSNLSGWEFESTHTQETSGDERSLWLVKEDNEMESVLIMISQNEFGLTFVGLDYGIEPGNEAEDDGGTRSRSKKQAGSR